MTRFRLRYRPAGAHVHVRVFAGPADGTLAVGNDVRINTFAALSAALEAKGGD